MPYIRKTSSICQRLRPTNFLYCQLPDFCWTQLHEIRKVLRLAASVSFGKCFNYSANSVNQPGARFSRGQSFQTNLGCHKSRPIFKMTIFHFKSSNFTISPLFPHLKDVKKQTFQNELSNRVSRPLLQRSRRCWLKNQSAYSEKLQRINRNR